MFNKQSILSAAGRFLPQEKIQLLSQAYDFANKITDITQNPKEALEKAGVTREDLEKAKKLINNPMAGFFLGDKKQSVIDGLNRAESLFDKQVNSLSEQAPVNELEQLQANLARLK
jgi:hypothetical protein